MAQGLAQTPANPIYRVIAWVLVARSSRLSPLLVGWSCLGAGIAGVCSSAPLRAEDSTDLQLSAVTIGIRGHYQVGRWTGIEGSIESRSWPVSVAVRVSDPDGNPTRYPIAEIAKPSTPSPARFRGLFKAGRLDGVIRIDLKTERTDRTMTLRAISGGGDDQSSAFHLPWTQQTQFWATLGDSAGFTRTVQRINDRSATDRLAVHHIELTESSQLPAQADALESLDLLVINGPQDIAADVNEGIQSWVIGGGHIIVSMGNSSEYAASPLADWIPLRLDGQSRLRRLDALTTQVPGSTAIRFGQVDALRFDIDYGETIAASLDGPLWARLPCGFGRVTILGVDLSRRPLVDWESLPLLCERLADFRRGTIQAQQRAISTRLSQTGISDLQTQLVTGLDQFPQIRQPTNWMVMGLMLLIMILIGPLDYLIVHKLLRRPHWTWATFPILVLTVSAAAVAMARQRFPTAPLASQVDLVDVDTASGRSRVRSWMSFTSSQSDRYRVDARLTGPVKPITRPEVSLPRLSWPAIPETGFRGMYRTSGLELAKPAYSFAPMLEAVLDLPVTQWSSAYSSAAWTGICEDPDQIITADLRAVAGQLTGTLTNRMPIPLEDWFVAFRGRVYLPETRRAGAEALKFRPGEVLDLTDRRRVAPRVLKHFLTGVRRNQVEREDQVGQQVEARRDVYDPQDRDPYVVMRVVSFYHACDGKDFTLLTNRTMSDLDLSPLLALDRAVLFGRLNQPTATFSINEQPLTPSGQTTIVRIVLPVTRE